MLNGRQMMVDKPEPPRKLRWFSSLSTRSLLWPGRTRRAPARRKGFRILPPDQLSLILAGAGLRAIRPTQRNNGGNPWHAKHDWPLQKLLLQT